MPYPNDISTVATGQTHRGGRTAPATGIPSWVPPVGMFADVPMVNSLAALSPSIYPGNAYIAPFIDWCGSVFLRDYSPLGVQMFWGAGHETSPIEANIQLSITCDFSTLLWSVKNVPAQANIVDTFQYNKVPSGGTNLAGWPDRTSAGMPGTSTNDGTPYAGHTYQGVQEFPAAWGGGPKGSMLVLGIAGSEWFNQPFKIDPTQAIGGYAPFVTTQAQNAKPTKVSFGDADDNRRGNYTMSAMDTTREGWWFEPSGGTFSYLLFIHRSGTITQYPALGGNNQSAGMILCPEYDLLINIDGGKESNLSHRRLSMRNLITGVVTSSQALGVVPALTEGYDAIRDFHMPGTLGMQWVSELGCAVGIDMLTNPANVTIVKLTPPATNPTVNPWTWSTVPLTHWAAGNASGFNKLRVCTNTAWSKLRWIPTLQAFVITCDIAQAGVANPQVIKIS